jgi:NAD(P)-dependent dehydrogenase (short-subunit alcohol dehydrogenase family)
VLTATREQLEADFATNVHGTLGVVRAFVPVLAQNGGGTTIVNVLSLSSLASVPTMAGYSASKAAAYSLTQALRAELRAKNIAVLAALPGAGAAQGRRPAGILEDPGIGLERDVGVDQRRAAEPAAHQDTHVARDAEVEQAGAPAQVVPTGVHLEVTQRAGQRRRVVAGVDLPTPFEDGDAPARPGHATGQHPAAVPRPHDDDVVVVGQLGSGRGERVHGGIVLPGRSGVNRLVNAPVDPPSMCG